MSRCDVLFIKEDGYRNRFLFKSPAYNTVGAVSLCDAQAAMNLYPNIIVFLSAKPVNECIDFIRKNKTFGRHFIVCNSDASLFFQFAHAGATKYFVNADNEKIIEAILRTPRPIRNKMPINNKIVDILIDIGIPLKCTGFNYLRDCIQAATENPALTVNISRYIYGSLAKKYSTAVHNIERDIRHAILLAYNSEKIYKLNGLFGRNILTKPEKPTNGDIIVIISEMLLMNLY